MSFLRQQLDKIYTNQLVAMKNGSFYKIKEVVGWDLPSALILVNYVEGEHGWVDIRTEKLKEAI